MNSSTFWAGAGAGYVGLADPTVSSTFSITFLDIGSSTISTATLNLMPQLAVPNGNPFNYKQYTLRALAPAGTASVRVAATMGNAYANPTGGDQAFVVDAFSLTAAVPEPASIGTLGLAGLALLARRRK